MVRSVHTLTSCISTKSPSAAYTNMECASSDTPSLLTEPALTRLRESHPWVLLPGIFNKADVVFLHVSGGRELLLKPGLNIMGGVQPRGDNDVIADDMLDMLLSMGIVDEATVIPSDSDEVDAGAIVMS